MSEVGAQEFANVGVELLQPVALSKRNAITNVDDLGVIERFRFADIALEVAQWAQLLRQKGLQPGDRVVVVAGNAWDWRCALFGVLYAGGVAVACPASASVPDIHAIAADASASLLLPIPARPDLVKQAGPIVLSADELSALDAAIAIGQPAHRSLPGDEALILYSHTSTGLRGVVHTHGSLISQAAAPEHWLGVREDERVFSTAEDGSAASIWLLLAAWRARASVVSVGLELEPEAQLELLDRLRPAAVWFSDDEYGMLASTTASPWVDLSPIRRALVSDESSAGATAFADAFGAGLVPLFECKEVGVIAGWPSGSENKAVPGSGLPSPGVQLAIVDERGAELPPGQVGDMVVRADSPSLFSGYTGAEGTRRQDTWLALGWQGALSADGSLRVVSRSDETELVEAEVDLPVADPVEKGNLEAERETAEAEAGRRAEQEEQAQREAEHEAEERARAEAAALAEGEAEERRRVEDEKNRGRNQGRMDRKAQRQAKREAKEREKEEAARAKREAAEAEERRRREEEEAKEREKAEAAALVEREAEERRRAKEEARAERRAARQRRGRRQRRQEKDARRRAEQEAREREKAEEAERAAREAEEQRLAKEAARAEKERERERQREEKEVARAQRKAARASRFRRTKESAPAENAKRRRKKPRSVAVEDAEPERLNTEMVARIKQYGMTGSQPEPDQPPKTEAVNPPPTEEPTERADSD